MLEETEFPETAIRDNRHEVKKIYKNRRKKKKRGVKKGSKRSVSVKKAYGIKVPPAAVLKKTKDVEMHASEFINRRKRIKLEEKDSSEIVQSSTSPGGSIVPSSPFPKNTNGNASLPSPNAMGPKTNLSLPAVRKRSKRRRLK
ncbi:uncharacterized protein LOC129226385 [Uloborus diversus]|uniref:uncharacterized protein LOC129226385 n=1 Tax=Uloborus diversus TaxID=327109 RepID=UPI002409D79E|nr:uncharacterized protein LOC129226385 [Uloborus diversus]